MNRSGDVATERSWLCIHHIVYSTIELFIEDEHSRGNIALLPCACTSNTVHSIDILLKKKYLRIYESSFAVQLNSVNSILIL